MKKSDEALSLNSVVALPVLIGLAGTLLSMLAGAFLVKAGRMGESAIPAFAVVFLALGSMLAAFLAARRAPHNRLPWGLAAGALVLLCLVVLSLSWFAAPVDRARLMTNAAISLAAAFVGAFIGSRRRKKRKRRRNV